MIQSRPFAIAQPALDVTPSVPQSAGESANLGTVLVAPPAPQPIVEQFNELRATTTRLQSSIQTTAGAVATDHREVALRNHTAKRPLLRWSLPALSGAGGAGAAIAIGLGLWPIAAAAGVAAIATTVATEVWHAKKRNSEVLLIGTSAAQKADVELDKVLAEAVAEVHSGTLSPTSLAALGPTIEHWLEHGFHNRPHLLNDERRTALQKILWKSVEQPHVDTARATRWLAFHYALDQVESSKKGESSKSWGQGFASVARAFDGLTAEERTAFAPMLRELLFDGERPRKPAAFDAAVRLHATLAEILGDVPQVRPAQPVSAPTIDEPVYARFAREMQEVEALFAKSLLPLREAPKAGAQDDPQSLWLVEQRQHYIAPDNNLTIYPEQIGEALDRAAAPWHTPLEQAGIAILLGRYRKLLDTSYVIGTAVRAHVDALLERKLPPADVEAANRLFATRDAFREIHGSYDTKHQISIALGLFDRLSDDEATGLAPLFRSQAFGTDGTPETFFPGAIELFRALRAAMDGTRVKTES